MLKTLALKYPKFICFVKNRFDSEVRSGLFLTTGFIIISFFTYVFLSLIKDLIGQTTLSQLDFNLLNKIQTIRTPFLNKFMLYITHFGDWQIILGVFVIAVFTLLLLKKWKYILALSISTIGGEIFVYTMKNIIKRHGPPMRYTIFMEHDFSFPSGHGFIAVAFYGLLFYFIFRYLISKYLKVLIIIIGFALIVLIGFSRIYLGLHWPSDVLASFESGIILITLIITFLEINEKLDIKI
ncbi:MAG: phosphatase PAP2 family protein [Cyanobacteria bacterium]|nr:phosphatase PAP2 family protein [Cyanobacteriota bacterium]